MTTKLLISAVAVAAAFTANVYAADVVTSGDLNSIDHWYGRAGGLTGSDRVGGLQSGGGKVGISYDADVAARTNMQRAEGSRGDVGVSYDADVANRTNMPRGTAVQQPAQAAGVEGAKHN